MPHWQSEQIAVDGLNLHCTRTGGDGPPVVLAHGFSDDGLCWTPVAEALAPDYDVIMVDARGHGRSDAPERGYGSAEHAGDLAGVIRALGLARPAVLGHSMGAMTTLVLAGTYPDLPGAILLEDPPPWWVAARTAAAAGDEERWAQMRARTMGLKRKTRAELIAEQHEASPTWSEAELGPWADSKHRMSLNVLNRGASLDMDWSAVLGRISCPALLITADPASGAIVTPEDAQALQQLIPQLRVAHLARAGHNIRREQFARYLELVRGFLAEPMGA
jgi:pimeloyl-ACP methyl ester carboxylesterase